MHFWSRAYHSNSIFTFCLAPKLDLTWNAFFWRPFVTSSIRPNEIQTEFSTNQSLPISKHQTLTYGAWKYYTLWNCIQIANSALHSIRIFSFRHELDKHERETLSSEWEEIIIFSKSRDSKSGKSRASAAFLLAFCGWMWTTKRTRIVDLSLATAFCARIDAHIFSYMYYGMHILYNKYL